MSLHGGMFASNLGSGGSGIVGPGRAFGMGLKPQPFDFGSMFKNVGNFLGGAGGQGFMDLASLGLGAFGLNKSLGFQEDQLGILKDQENRAAGAQKFQTGNSLALQLQTTTPGTPEHERVKQLIAEGNFNTA